MILLDTNVLSEVMKPKPDGRVARWMAAQSATTLYVSSIAQAEILHGILLLPAGKRRKALETAAKGMFEEDFQGRILAFDSDAAYRYARIAVDRRRLGRPISHFDAQIAAIASTASATLATRDAADFDGCGIKIIDPWKE
jgi:predicted nucleic acid-binding protein